MDHAPQRSPPTTSAEEWSSSSAHATSRGGEEAAFPIGDGLAGAEAIEIDGDIDALAGEGAGEAGEGGPPVVIGEGGPALAGGAADAVAPREDFEAARGEGIAVAEEAVGPVELEIAAAPDRGASDMGELEGAVDPAAAAPIGRADVPIGMIIEGDEADRERRGCGARGR